MKTSTMQHGFADTISEASKPTRILTQAKRTGFVYYFALMAVTVGLFLLIVHSGISHQPFHAALPTTHSSLSGKVSVFVHVMIVLGLIVVVGLVLSWLLRFVGQPPVIGEVLAGILLGPSLLGRFWPEASEFIFPQEVGPYISVIAQLGVILYMFLNSSTPPSERYQAAIVYGESTSAE
jgi:hypothetical protein